MTNPNTPLPTLAELEATHIEKLGPNPTAEQVTRARAVALDVYMAQHNAMPPFRTG